MEPKSGSLSRHERGPGAALANGEGVSVSHRDHSKLGGFESAGVEATQSAEVRIGLPSHATYPDRRSPSPLSADRCDTRRDGDEVLTRLPPSFERSTSKIGRAVPSVKGKGIYIFEARQSKGFFERAR